MIFVPNSHQDLLLDSTKAFAYLATTMNDGSPQVTPLWFNIEGDYILINSASNRVKDKNMRARPKVALAISDPENPYRYIQIRGIVTEYITDGAENHIDILNFKYRGTDTYPAHDVNHPRVIYKIKPESVNTKG